MEQAAGARYCRNRIEAARGTPVVVRYADDFVVLCDSREQAEQAAARLIAWLAPRGLSINEDKTRITDVHSGFDFLGFNIRRYVVRGGEKLFIKPSEASVRRVRDRLKTELRALRGANAEEVMYRLNPIIRGWSMYFRGVVSSAVFSKLDNVLWWGTWRWARFRHPTKPRKWVKARYFGSFHPTRRNRWVFGDRETGAYLLQFSWTPIVRHVLVRGGASPDDPALNGYWAARRRRRKPPPLDRTTLHLLKVQKGRCVVCDEFLLFADAEPGSPQEWERWLGGARKALRKQRLVTSGATTADGRPAVQRVHDYCQRIFAPAGCQ